MQMDHRLRVLEYRRVGGDDLSQDTFCFFHVVGIADSKCHIDPALPLRRQVLDDVTPDLVVWQYQRLIVEGEYGCVDQTHMTDGTENAAGFHHIFDVKRAVKQDHQT